MGKETLVTLLISEKCQTLGEIKMQLVCRNIGEPIPSNGSGLEILTGNKIKSEDDLESK